MHGKKTTKILHMEHTFEEGREAGMEQGRRLGLEQGQKLEMLLKEFQPDHRKDHQE